jgi:predicted RNA-binding protein
VHYGLYILKEKKEEKVMESVQHAVASGNQIILEDIFGAGKKISAVFKFFDAENDKIVFEADS